jgi:hypothetical protein
VTPAEIEEVRRAERRRLAALLHENAETIADFAKDGESAVRVVALMLELDGAR